MIAKIGITAVNTKAPASGAEMAHLGWTYIHAVTRAGGVPFLLPSVTEPQLLDRYVEACDGFLFSGGIDVAPCCYGEAPHPLVGENSLKLDKSQIGLMKRVIAARKPFLAICRGHQVLNVACGGTLYQDNQLHGDQVMKHMQQGDRGDVSHEISIQPGSILHQLFGSRIWTNSYHHQSIRRLGEGLVVTASADDGIVESVALADYPFGIGVQWHPEVMLLADDGMLPLFEAFIKEAGR